MKGSPSQLLILNLSNKHQFWINKIELEAKFADLAPGFTRATPTNWLVKPDSIVIYYKLTIWNEDESFEESYKGKLFVNYIII